MKTIHAYTRLLVAASFLVFLSLPDLSAMERMPVPASPEKRDTLVLVTDSTSTGKPATEILKGKTAEGVLDGKVLDEVVVSAKYSNLSTNNVRQSLSRLEISRSAGNNLASLLENINGVSSISTGTNISKPVIHGMSGNRILIVNDGIRQTGQDWGRDHAPEIDANSSGSIQVIKGSDAISYGSGALGGIIVMEPDALPYYGKAVNGRFSTLYGSNGHRYMVTGQLDGALPCLPDLAWRVQGTYANSGDRSTAHYVLNNTGCREMNLSASLGYNHPIFQVEATYSFFRNKIGVMQCSQLGSRDMFEERIELGRPQHVDPYSRHIGTPYQDITHQNAMGKAKVKLGRGGGFLHWRGSWQNDLREEYNHRRTDSTIPTVSLALNSFQNKLWWALNWKGWKFEAGAQVIYVENHSHPETGSVPIIPNYVDFQTGVYGSVKYKYRRFGAEAGVRFDHQLTRAKGFDWTGEEYGGEHKYDNPSYSVGLHYDIMKDMKIVTNFGAAWRAPHVYELYSNGNDLGAGLFVKGDPDMKSERSYKWITSFEYEQKYVGVSIDAYLQWIDGYIYDQPTKEFETVLSGTYPIFQYRQTPAFFRGVDASLRVSPWKELDYRISAALICANERVEGRFLPYIPPFRLRHGLSWKHRFNERYSMGTEVAHRFVAKQHRFDPETDLVPFTPPAYHLLDLYAHVDFHLPHQQLLRLMVAVENATNREYKEYTNRARYYAHDKGIDARINISYTF